MTIIMRKSWNGLEYGTIQNLGDTEEARLVGLGMAEYYVPEPSITDTALVNSARQIVTATGRVLAGVVESQAFSVALQFARDSYLAEKVIGGPMTFTADLSRAIPGGSVTMRLIANGVNAPVFQGMKEAGSSMGWVNTAGILNNVVAYFDGVEVYYSISRAVGVSPVPVPTISTASAPVGAPSTISLVYGVALDPSQVPPVSAFAVTNSGGAQNVTAVAINGNTVTLTTSRAALGTDTITVNYTPPASDTSKIKALGGIYAAALVNRAVAAPVTEQVVRIGSLAGITEGGNASGYSYTGVTAAFAGSAGLGTVSLPANTAASVRAHLAANSTNFIMGLQPNNAAANYTAYAVGIFATGVGGAYQQIVGGAPSAMPVTVNQAANDIIELASDAAGNQVARVSQDGGNTWTTLRTFPAVNTARKYINICFGTNGASVTKLMGTGVA